MTVDWFGFPQTINTKKCGWENRMATHVDLHKTDWIRTYGFRKQLLKIYTCFDCQTACSSLQWFSDEKASHYEDCGTTNIPHRTTQLEVDFINGGADTQEQTYHYNNCDYRALEGLNKVCNKQAAWHKTENPHSHCKISGQWYQIHATLALWRSSVKVQSFWTDGYLMGDQSVLCIPPRNLVH